MKKCMSSYTIKNLHGYGDGIKVEVNTIIRTPMRNQFCNGELSSPYHASRL